ncbi:MAG TPA: DUF2007 domain-containing protein [Candidatus Acidoferrales bacterium]|nr:DUF2007 domain-containing protein [Candidatus Acidoferrales bacterium]
MAQAYDSVMEHPKLIVIASYGNPLEAELAITALDAAGIPAMRQADTAGGMREHLAWSGRGFEILVREDDAAAAREVLTAPATRDSPSEE